MSQKIQCSRYSVISLFLSHFPQREETPLLDSPPRGTNGFSTDLNITQLSLISIVTYLFHKYILLLGYWHFENRLFQDAFPFPVLEVVLIHTKVVPI